MCIPSHPEFWEHNCFSRVAAETKVKKNSFLSWAIPLCKALLRPLWSGWGFRLQDTHIVAWWSYSVCYWKLPCPSWGDKRRQIESLVFFTVLLLTFLWEILQLRPVKNVNDQFMLMQFLFYLGPRKKSKYTKHVLIEQ